MQMKVGVYEYIICIKYKYIVIGVNLYILISKLVLKLKTLHHYPSHGGMK